MQVFKLPNFYCLCYKEATLTQLKNPTRNFIGAILQMVHNENAVCGLLGDKFHFIIILSQHIIWKQYIQIYMI